MKEEPNGQTYTDDKQLKASCCILKKKRIVLSLTLLSKTSEKTNKSERKKLLEVSVAENLLRHFHHYSYEL